MNDLKNNFTIAYLENTFKTALDLGYKFLRIDDFIKAGCPQGKYCILRLDLDFKPAMLRPFTALSQKLNIPFTVFVRVAGPYNIFWHPHFSAIDEAYKAGCEIGLHTTPVEWSIIQKRKVEDVFAGELNALRSLFPVTGIAPHRDINYMYNSLPWLNENWTEIKQSSKIDYHAYEERLTNNALYINEGFSPHLTWRNMPLHESFESGKNIYALLHPHWWYVDHAFEAE
jgi:hypothetical protein